MPCTKGEIALDLLDQVRAEGLAHQALVADAGYGLSVDFRRGLEDRHEAYVVSMAGKEAVFSEPPTFGQWGPILSVGDLPHDAQGRDARSDARGPVQRSGGFI